MVDSALYTIVCGMPRCGTRQFADLLNRDERVCLQGEISSRLIGPIFKLVMAADAAYQKPKHLKLHLKKRNDSIIELFSLFSKAKKNMKPGAKIHGFKTPNIELYYKQLSAMILLSFDRLIYFYCIRNIIDCYLSYSTMQFSMNPDQFISRYIASLKAARKIRTQSKRKKSTIGIQILNLDNFIATSEKANWIVANLYKPLGIKVQSEIAIKYIMTTENRNATVKATGREREKKLPKDIESFFINKKEIINVSIDKFNNDFVENLHRIEIP